MFVHGDQPEAMLRYAAYKMGVDLDEIKGINLLSASAMMDRWRTGENDFFHEQGPYPHYLDQEGFGYTVASVGDAVGPVDWIGSGTACRFTAAFRSSKR